MEFFRIKKDIPFMRHALVLNVISTLVFLAAVFFLFSRGLHLSIEFTGGTVMEITYEEPANLDEIRQTLEKQGYTDTQVQSFGTAQDVLIRLPLKGENSAQVSQKVFTALCAAEEGDYRQIQDAGKNGEPRVRDACADRAGTEPVQLQRVEFVGPQVGEELAEDGLLALLVVIAGIMVYLAFRFEWKFAVAAIIANLHDVVIILGFFAFFQWEFSLTVLAAVLAVLGYSVNESVVVFDRVRETFRDRRFSQFTTAQVIDHAITRTISRTIITHGSTEIMVVSMLIFGGPTLFYFALALTIGILFGIYSSVFVGSAVAMWLGIKREDMMVPVKPKDENDGAVV
jgi:preprotein translocase subunit SecF